MAESAVETIPVGSRNLTIGVDELCPVGQTFDEVAISDDILKQLTAMSDHNMYDFFAFRISLELRCVVADLVVPRLHCHNYKATMDEEWQRLQCDIFPPDDCCIVLYNFRYMGTDYEGRPSTKHRTLLINWCPTAALDGHVKLYMKGKDLLARKISHIFHDILEFPCSSEDELALQNVINCCLANSK